MKPGLEIGYVETLKVVVTSDMFASFNEKVVHPLYSTVSLVHHMEWVSRKVILPFLEEHEEGMGAEVSVKHLSPAKEGSNLLFSAKVIESSHRSVVTEVEVKCGEVKIAIGNVRQAILPKKTIQSFY
ncbi:thioesterase family protein [Peribacillus alkalitolerans]|uniref:thioesterase family protein n=1 Tax=Peribacillus alkalitolerans TaxID=1550385 RepID=UPI0013D298D3|nr:hotdog domain-containing protein [Peribacillus alkalitolerans]